jgi:uncharacterized membrane protein
MSFTVFFLIALVETAFIGGMFLLYPRFARRGLLFGVYVGEQVWAGGEAREITQSWYRAMIAWLVIALLAAIALSRVVPAAILIGPFPLALATGFVVLYLRAYFRARRFAVDTSPPAVAIVETRPEGFPVLPSLALAAGLIGGTIAVVYAAIHYPDLPARVPTHFGVSGAPDAWRPKSLSSVMLLPLLTLLVGVGLGVISIFTARAKRAVRYPHTEISLQAQMRFRRAVTRMISTVSLLIAVMLTLMTVATIRVGLGLARAIPWPILGLAAALVAVAIGGSIYIGLRYGQGGARLERQAAFASLTNGLADNRHWVLGHFYVNRDDPSFLVEDRFGLGYTLNFGNRKAVVAFVGFVAAILALVAAAIIFT